MWYTLVNIIGQITFYTSPIIEPNSAPKHKPKTKHLYITQTHTDLSFHFLSYKITLTALHMHIYNIYLSKRSLCNGPFITNQRRSIIIGNPSRCGVVVLCHCNTSFNLNRFDQGEFSCRWASWLWSCDEAGQPAAEPAAVRWNIRRRRRWDATHHQWQVRRPVYRGAEPPYPRPGWCLSWPCHQNYHSFNTQKALEVVICIYIYIYKQYTYSMLLADHWKKKNQIVFFPHVSLDTSFVYTIETIISLWNQTRFSVPFFFLHFLYILQQLFDRFIYNIGSWQELFWSYARLQDYFLLINKEKNFKFFY